ncbi:MAG: ATP-binding cassette domain-containing protein [Methylobacteriaceae bacterium]|jgi:ATP-binding cassette subfamily F protein uup|nr:ATP-binding cassette domain-containing protein [Methylobacteriaceae bacterium]
MSPPVLHLKDIDLSFGGTPLLIGAELAIAPGERLCLVGRNGSGKSTLLKIAAGLVEADAGERFIQPGVTVRYLPQEPDLTGFATVLAYVEAGLAPGDDAYRARYVLEQLGLAGDADPALLSGGEIRRAALARVLAPQPDILLLDEPTNHLDLPTVEWLESELKALKSAMVLISHDRRFLESLSDSVVWLDRGTARRLNRGFAAFEEWRDDILALEEREAHKLDRRLVAEADWLRYGVTARRKRNVRRLSRLYALRKKRAELRAPVGSAAMTVTEAQISGNLVIEANDVAKAWDGRPFVRDFSFRLMRGDRIGLVGANGAGKTTLLNVLIGRLAPDSGAVRMGTDVETVVIDQNRESLDPEATLAETLAGRGADHVVIGTASKHVIGYMKEFLFTPEQARTPVKALSGGERNRLMLARALARPSNLLVLDEPTNDLDLETLDLLQEVVADYPGTVLLVSHDRDFLDRTVSAVLMAEGGGAWREYAGGYTDMLAQRGSGVERRTVEKTPAAVPSRPVESGANRKRKLSFNEQHDLKTLPGLIASLEADIGAVRLRLSDPAFYERDAAGFNTESRRLAALETELGAAEERWLTLELLREELEG